MMINTQTMNSIASIAHIIDEVRKNGFFTSFCDEIATADDHNQLIFMIKTIAKNANLQVSFDTSENVCIFEA